MTQHKRQRVFAMLTALSLFFCNSGVFSGTFAEGNTGEERRLQLVCGKEKHIHSEACYEKALICGEEEKEAVTEKVFRSNFKVHHHKDSCYDGSGNLTCGLIEDEYYHTHNEYCQDAEGNLVCGLGTRKPHEHTAECYQTERKLICGLEETEEHIHSDACYETTETLICEKPTTKHEHTAECYNAEGKVICGKMEVPTFTCTEENWAEEVKSEGHTHTEACYEERLSCSMEEHTHTEECYEEVKAEELTEEEPEETELTEEEPAGEAKEETKEEEAPTEEQAEEEPTEDLTETGPAEEAGEAVSEETEEEASEEPEEKAEEELTEEPTEETTGETAEEITEESGEESNEKLEEEPAEEKTEEETTEESAEEVAEESSEQPEETQEETTEETTEETAEEPVEETNEESTGESTEEVTEESGEESSEHPEEETTEEETTEEPAEETTEETAEEVTEESGEESSEKAEEKPAEETGEAVSEEQEEAGEETDKEQNEEPAEEQPEETQEETTEETAEEPAEETNEESTGESTEEVTEESGEESSEKPEEETAEETEPTEEETTEEPAEETGEAVSEEQEEVGEELTEEPTEEVGEETTEENLEKRIESADTAAYRVTISFNKDAGIPEGTEVTVNEADENGTKGAESAEPMRGAMKGPAKMRMSAKAAPIEEEPHANIVSLTAWRTEEEMPEIILYQKTLDISLVADGKEIEPDPEAKITVTVELPEIEDGQKVEVRHITEKGSELLESTNEGGSITFETDSFSLFEFTAKAQAISGWETEQTENTFYGKTTEQNAVATALTEMEAAEGLEILEAYSVTGSDDLWVAMGQKQMPELGERESITLYTVTDGKADAIVRENISREETIRFSTAEMSNYALVKDTGYRHKSLEMTIEGTATEEGGETASILLDGMMPKAATAAVADVTEAYADYAEQKKTDKQQTRTTLAAFDITISDSNSDYQPDAEHPVSVTISDERIVPGRHIELWHIKDDGTEEQVENYTITAGTLQFTAEGFSVYALVYTVDFYFGEHEFHMEGGDEMLLSELLRILSIDAELTGSSASFTNTDVMTITAVEENNVITDWKLTSIEPFTTQETLTVTLANGNVLEIRVTDKLNVHIDNTFMLTADRGAEILKDENGDEIPDENGNPIFIWNVGDSTTASNHSYTFRVSYQINTEASIDQWVSGQVEITLPLHVIKDSNGNYADRISLPIPEKGSPLLEGDTSTIFQYEIIEDHVLITNRLPVDTSSAAQIEFSYVTTEKTYMYPDEETLGSFSASFCVYDMDPATKTLKKDEKILEDVTSNSYSIQMNTGSSIVNSSSVKTTKEFAGKKTEWDESWGVAPEDAGNYWYYLWNVKSTIHSSQYFSYSIEDTPAIGELVGYQMSGEVFKTATTPGAGKTTTIQKAESGSVTRTDLVVTRLPKNECEALYESTGITLNNHVDATVTPTSLNDLPTMSQADAVYVDKKKEFHNAAGTVQGKKTGLTTSYELTNLMNPNNIIDKISGLEFSAEVSGNNSWTWTYSGPNTGETAPAEEADHFGINPVKYEIDDRILYLQYFDYNNLTEKQKENVTQGIINANMVDWKEGGTTYKQLDSNDYRIDSIEFAYSFRDARDDNNDLLYENLEFLAYYLDEESIKIRAQRMVETDSGISKPRLGDLVFTLYSNDEELGTVAYSFITNDITCTANAGASKDISVAGTVSLSNKTIVFDSSLNITGFVLSNENALYQAIITAKPSITLKKTTGNTVESLLNDLTINISDEPNRMIALVNRATMKAADKTTTKTARDDIISDTRKTTLEKKLTGRNNDIYNQVYVMNWQINLVETQTVAGVTDPVPQAGGTFYDYLPYEQDYVPDSIAVYANGVKLDKGEYTMVIEGNKYLTGREKMIINISRATEGNYSISYQTQLTWDSLIEQRPESGELYAHNAVIYRTGNDSISNANIAKGTYTDSKWIKAKSNSEDTKQDIDWVNGKLDDSLGDGEWKDETSRLIGTTVEFSIEAEVLGELDLHKTVRAMDVGSKYSSEDTVYTKGDVATGEDEYAYRITFGPVVGTKAKEIVFYDFLENYTPAGTDGSAWHGTLKNVDTSVLERFHVNAIVYYSTIDRSRLAELMASNNEIRNLNAKDGTTDIWIKASEYSGDLSNVTAIAVDISKYQDGYTNSNGGDDFILDGGNLVTIKIYMSAPEAKDVNIEEENLAYNETHMSLKQISLDANPDETRYISNAYTTLRLRVKGSLHIHKINSESLENAPDITFSLKGISKYGTIVDQTATSNGHGSLTFFRLEETAPDSPYELQELPGNPDYHYKDEVLYVWVDAKGNAKISTSMTEPNDYDTDLPVYVGYDSTTLTYEIKNDPRIHGALEFTKLNSITNEPVAGATFSISGTSYYNNEINLSATSDFNGVVIFPDIERGENYVLKETIAATGYSLANRTFLVSCNDYGVVTMEMDGAADENADNVKFCDDSTYTITDEPAFDLGLYKSDAINGEALSGAVFHLTGQTNHGDSVDLHATSQMDSSVIFRNLEAGHYVMVEETPPEKHIVDGIEYNIIIENSGKITISWDGGSMDNERTDPDSQEPIYVGLNGFGEDSEEDQRKYGERFFYAYYGRFNIPNDRVEDGIVIIEKVWLDSKGKEITETQNMTSPIINLDSMEVDSPKVSAMIDYRFQWKDPTRYYYGKYYNDFIKLKGTPKTFGQYTGDESIDDTWIQVGVCNAEYPGEVYVKMDSFGKVYWRPGPNVGKVFLPTNCENFFLIVASGKNTITTSVDLTGLHADKTTSMQSMFKDCTSLTSVTIPDDFNTSNVKIFQQMFANDAKLTSLDLSSLNTSKAENMTLMFSACAKLQYLDLSSFDLSNIISGGIKDMFSGCAELEHIYASNNWSDNVNVANSTGVFSNCKKLVGNGGATYNTPSNNQKGERANTGDTGLLTKGGSCPRPKRGSSSSSASGNVQPRENNIRKTTKDEKIESSEWNNGEYTGSEVNKWIRRPDGHWIYRMTVYNENTTFYVSEDIEDADGKTYLDPYDFLSMEDVNGTEMAQGGALSYTAGVNGYVLIKNKATNTSYTPTNGSVIITKKVIGSVRPNDEFQFTVTNEDNNISFKLKNGESKRITGLLGTVNISEESYSDYSTTITDESGVPNNTNTVQITINAGEQKQVLVTNTSNNGELDIKKIVSKTDASIDDPDPQDEYAFTVQLWTGSSTKTALTGSYGGYSFVSTTADGGTVGQATIRLKKDATVKLKNLPAGTKYSITEPQYSHFQTTITKQIGTGEPQGISLGESQSLTVTGDITAQTIDLITYTNTKNENEPTTSFVLKKQINGRDSGEYFSFSVVLQNLKPGKIYHYTIETTSTIGGTEQTTTAATSFTANPSGEYILSNLYISTRQTITFSGLPIGAQYNVTETANDYIASYEVSRAGMQGVTSARNTITQRSLSTGKRTLTTNGAEDTILFTNTEKTFPIAIRKENAGSAMISGATLELYELNVVNTTEGTIQESTRIETAKHTGLKYTHVSSASAAWALNLFAGSYVLTEKAAPAGYAKSDDIRIDIDDNGNITWWKVTSDPQYDGIGADVTNTDLQRTYTPTGSRAKDGNVHMKDLPFEITVFKTEANGTTPVLNANLQIIKTDDETIVANWTTGLTAHTVSGGLDLNTDYTLREYRAPEGYKKADPIRFILIETNSDPYYKLQILNGNTFEDAPSLSITMKNVSEISFSKRWYLSMNGYNQEWPDNAVIEIKITRTKTPVNSYDHKENGGTTEEDQSYAPTFTITKAKATGGTAFVSNNDDSIAIMPYITGTGGTIQYLFSISGAVKYGTEGNYTYRYDYYFSETKAHEDGSNEDLRGYFAPKHLYYGTIYNESFTRDGGVISNDTLIPSPTGFSTRRIPYLLILVFGMTLLIGSVGIIKRKGRGETSDDKNAATDKTVPANVGPPNLSAADVPAVNTGPQATPISATDASNHGDSSIWVKYPSCSRKNKRGGDAG